MLADPRASTPSRFRFPPALHANAEAAGGGGQALAVLKGSGGSLAVSMVQAHLQESLFEFARLLIVGPSHAALADSRLSESLFPAVIDKACFEREHRERWQLENGLRMAFDEAPVEDGIDHAAERIIEEALRCVDEKRALCWLGELALDAEHPTLAASVLRCLGRCQPGTAVWRAGVVRAALAIDDVEVRDAAAQAAESWREPETRAALQSHAEAVPWLRAYIENIVEDFGE